MQETPARYLRESDIEKFLCDAVSSLGGECLKWESKRTPGLPDRLIFLNGHFYLIELKTERGRLSSRQIEMHKRLERQGFPVKVLFGIEQVREFAQGLSEHAQEGQNQPF